MNYYFQNNVIFLQSDEVYLEAQIQNLTAGPICLEKVALESSHLFSGKFWLYNIKRKPYSVGIF